MRQSDIEKLLNSGYSQEEIELAINELSKINLSQEEMKTYEKKRDDRGVVVTPKDGESRKTSSIMMGYNKEGITLENGDYVNFDELAKALEEELNKDSEDVIYISRKTGKNIERTSLIEELLKNVIKKNSNIRLEETDIIKNQRASKIILEDNKLNKEFNKGILMLGNKKVLLPNGKYVLSSEIEEALNDYIKMVPDRKEDIDIIDSIDLRKEKKYRVIERVKKKMSMIPMIIALLSTILSGFKIENKYDSIKVTSKVSDANFSVDSLTEKSEEEIIREVEEKIGNLKTGDKITVNKGIDYHASSDYKYGGSTTKGTFGINNKEGEYNIDYISVVYNKEIVQVKYNKNEDLNTTLDKVANTLKTTVDSLETYIHLGGPTSGWVDVSDLIKQETENIKKDRKVLLDVKENIKGTDYNFNGNTITINDNGEDVILNVTDNNGNILRKGSIVVGSNGKEYKIQSIKLEDRNVLNIEKEYAGKTLTWSVHNFNKDLTLASLAPLVLATVLTKKEEKEKTTMSFEEIDLLVERAKERFEDESSFIQATQIITKKEINKDIIAENILKDSLISQSISVEDINNMGVVR